MRVSTFALRPMAVGMALAAFSGGHAAWEATAKAVTVTVDGQQRTLTTHAGTIGDVLDKAGISVGAHDLLAPAATAKVKDGSTVVLRHGRQIALTVDGRARTVWVTAMSVDEALDQLRVADEGAVLSADRSRALPLKGFSLDVRTRKDVQVLVGGKRFAIETNALQVSEVLAQLKVVVRKADKVSHAGTAPVTDGLVVKVTRIDGKSVSEDLEIAFATERRADKTMLRGTTKVLQHGRVGVLHRTYALKYVNGRLAARTLVKAVRTAEPVTHVVAYGTRVPKRSVAGADGLNWRALARCESGGNPRAVSSGGTYRGLYQFSLSTWHRVGGEGDPIDASAGEQTYRAKLLYKRSGRSPWPHCGQYL